MESETYRICLDPTLQILEEFLFESNSDYLKDPTQSMILDLRFFKQFFWGLAYWEESAECDWHLRYAIGTMVPKLRKTAKEFEADFGRAWDRDGQRVIWEEISYNLEKRIQQFKPQVKEICILILSSAFKCESCKHNQKLFLEHGREVPSFVDFILKNLKALLCSNIDVIALVKQQIVFVQRKLKEFQRFVNSANLSITKVKKLNELICRSEIWVKRISCLSCLYWIDGKDESLASTMESMVSDFMMHKFVPYIPGVLASYFQVEDTTIPQLLFCYLDSLFKDLVIPMKDDNEILCEVLIFLSSFVVDPPEEDSKDRELILAQIYAIINELPSLICSICFDEMKEGESKANFYSFLQKINRLKAKIKELYVMTPRMSQFESPKTNPIGFLDSLLITLKKMLEAKVNFIPSIKHQIEIVLKELALLRAFLQDNIGLQNESREFKDLWTRSIDVMHHASYVTNLCFARSSFMWYGILGLLDIIEDIKLIKDELQKIEGQDMYKNKVLHAEMESSVAPRATTSKIEEAFIGFEEDANLIIGHLTRGQKNLTIISISGLPGQGKTTLAKRIYNDFQIQHHFHKIAWCYVSKECEARELLIKISCDLININGVNNLKFDELADHLRKSLKGQRYLIVMDDIWDVAVWNQVQISFPDDNKGSRILFTSHNHDLASQTKLNFIPHPLRLFSKKESWELMKKKLFLGHSESLPEFSKVAQQIASYCKGLPLAIALIASLLQNMERKLDLWSEVAKNLKSHLANEGCWDIIELSYKYLPDHLKSCFLYFGVFPRGKNISAKKLKRLWIAEGFVEDNNMQGSQDLAREYLDNLAKKYLDDLVSQNLVVVAEKSSTGDIKKCNVHDLLYDLCLEKAKEENFFARAEKSVIVNQCYITPQKYSYHRLCVRTGDPFIDPGTTCTRKELPTSKVHSILWFFHHVHSRWKLTYESISGFVKSFKVLTVLNLDGVILICGGFPELLLSMIHLRYLALEIDDRSSGSLAGIPSSIANLWNLETLIVRHQLSRRSMLLPDSMWKMKSLRHVYVDDGTLLSKDVEENNLFEASNIETLGNVFLDHRQKKEFLKKLPQLRKLVCYTRYTRTLLGSQVSMQFKSLKNLESLNISFQGICVPLVKRVVFKFPENVKKLNLYGLELEWSAISEIGKQLPNLQVLKLRKRACMGRRWKVEDGDFPRLTYLKLQMLNIKEIDDSGCMDNPPFPVLEHLIVVDCRNLKEIPSRFGEICSLKTITMPFHSRQLTDSVMQILDFQRDMGNKDLQLLIRD